MKFGSFLILLTALSLTACEVGPDYVRPPAVMSQGWKESGEPHRSDVWRIAAPQDEMPRGEWWRIYHDPMLNRLEARVVVSNQNLKAAEAAYRQAVAVVEQTQSGLFPNLSVNASSIRSGTPVGSTSVVETTHTLVANASWSLDVWGRIQRSIESNSALAEAGAADLASARLSAQGALAADYFALRVQDKLTQLLKETLEAEKKITAITQDQFDAGAVARADVLAAQTQEETTHAALIDTGVRRAQLEHAIAVLIGQPPSGFAIAAEDVLKGIPTIPVSIPSALLERRPDIASNERQMAAANAAIGVAESAWFPDLSLSASGGVTATTLSQLFRASSGIWSFGPSAAESIIDFGARDAEVEQARASYDQSVANYRQTVLTAFQQVEDNLSSLRILADEAAVEEQAVISARLSKQVSLSQYQEGAVSFNSVLTAELLRLQNEETALTILSNRLTASVALIQAMGGGWGGVHAEVKQLNPPPPEPAPIPKPQPVPAPNKPENPIHL